MEEAVGVDIGHKDGKKVGEGDKVEVEEGKVDVGPSHGRKEMNEDERPCWHAPSFIIVVRWNIDAGQESLDIVVEIIISLLDGCLGLHVDCC